MNTLLFICFVVASIEAHTIHLSKSQREKALIHTGVCIKDSGVKPEVLAEARKGIFENDDGLKKFTLCFFQKSGIISDDGKINVEQALSKLPTGIDKASAQKLLEEWKNKSGKDPSETALEIYKCYYHGTKQHILF